MVVDIASKGAHNYLSAALCPLHVGMELFLLPVNNKLSVMKIRSLKKVYYYFSKPLQAPRVEKILSSIRDIYIYYLRSGISCIFLFNEFPA